MSIGTEVRPVASGGNVHFFYEGVYRRRIRCMSEKEGLDVTRKSHPQCVTIDPRNPNHAYCGTFGDGLWKTEDIGQTWNKIGKDVIASNDITSVSISRLDHGNKMFVGTEPTTLYRSNVLLSKATLLFVLKLEIPYTYGLIIH